MLDRIRNQASRSLLKASRRLATDDGWAQLCDGFGAPSMLGGLLRLRQRGVQPQSVVDGGACVGDWSRLFHHVFPDARILMVDAQLRHADRLAAMAAARPSHLRASSALLGPPGLASVTFTTLDDAAGGTGSSVLPERSDVPRHTETLPVTTLDALVAEHGFGAPDFVKLDVQGYEIEVLQGARQTLRTVRHLLLEVSLTPYNEGSPLIDSVLPWMGEQGFVVDEIFDLSRRDDVLVQVDLLFSRRDADA